MSIVAGFRCYDGVVIATDSEHTAGQSKFYAPKIFEVKPEHGLLYLAGTGDNESRHLVVDRVKARIEGRNASLDQMKAVVEEVISEHYRGPLSAARQAGDPNAPTMDFLMAAHEHKGKTMLYKIRETGVISPVDSGYVVLGTEAAETLLRELADIFFKDYATSVFPMSHLAAHMIHRVVRYASYCGGRAQIACLSNGGLNYFHNEASSEAGEDYLSYLLTDMPDIAEACITGRPGAFDAYTKRFAERLRDVMEKGRKRYGSEAAFPEADGWGGW